MKWLLALVVLLGAALVPISPASARSAAWPSVSQGASGPAVQAIQHLLTAHGFATTADGQFGPVTDSRVRGFQQSRGLVVDGLVGPQTWPVLVVAVGAGATGPAVNAVQATLRGHGYAVAVDGRFGPQTEAAVRGFQTQRGLPVDGVVNPATWSSLVEAAPGDATAALPLPRSAVSRAAYAQPHWNSTQAVDLIVPTGTPVHALMATTTQHINTDSCGNGLRLNFANGDRFVYCHLDSRSVGSGVPVGAGQLVGYSGDTGNSGAPHLHVEVRTGDGAIRCPQPLLLAIYDGAPPPAPRSLPTTGCTVG